ncbi:MAG: helix-turn-helix domain-containing protein [Clostridiaceae bacterium]
MENKINSNNLLYTVSEVAELLRVNKNTVYDLIKRNLLIGLKLGSMKVTKAELLRFLKENNGKDLTDLDNIKNLSF